MAQSFLLPRALLLSLSPIGSAVLLASVSSSLLFRLASLSLSTLAFACVSLLFSPSCLLRLQLSFASRSRSRFRFWFWLGKLRSLVCRYVSNAQGSGAINKNNWPPDWKVLARCYCLLRSPISNLPILGPLAFHPLLQLDPRQLECQGDTERLLLHMLASKPIVAKKSCQWGSY